MTFRFSVMVDGTDIAAIVPSGDVSISYGRQTLTEQPSVTTAVVEIITKDAPDVTPSMIYSYPEFSLGNHSMPSGFTPTYADLYEGATSRITLGADVVIGAHTPSGFLDTYEDVYTSGADWTRFTGRVVAIDYDPDRIQLTCTSPAEALGRREITKTAWPQETDTARAERILPGIAVLGASSFTVAADNTGNTTTVLQALTDLAKDTDGIVLATREGTIEFRTADEWTDSVVLPPDITLLDPLSMSTDLGLIVNTVSVEYGAAGDRHTLTDGNAASVAEFGEVHKTYKTQLSSASDAQTFADLMLTRYAQPHWAMPSAVVDMSLADDSDRGLVCDLDLGDTVYLPILLAGSPSADYTSEVLGITETLAVDHWKAVIHLAPMLTPITRKAHP